MTRKYPLFQNLVLKLCLLINSHNLLDLGKGFLENKNISLKNGTLNMLGDTCRSERDLFKINGSIPSKIY